MSTLFEDLGVFHISVRNSSAPVSQLDIRKEWREELENANVQDEVRMAGQVPESVRREDHAL